jgi:hypothetical protein
MSLKCLCSLGATLALLLAGCTSPDIHAIWPAPRSLGKELPAYQPPIQLPAATPLAREFAEPAGVLTLLQAQALALWQNPQLAAFGWEVRAGEARTLQASLPPNPEFGLEVENFAGSGALRGWQSTASSLSWLVSAANVRVWRRWSAI